MYLENVKDRKHHLCLAGGRSNLWKAFERKQNRQAFEFRLHSRSVGAGRPAAGYPLLHRKHPGIRELVCLQRPHAISLGAGCFQIAVGFEDVHVVQKFL